MVSCGSFIGFPSRKRGSSFPPGQIALSGVLETSSTNRTPPGMLLRMTSTSHAQNQSTVHRIELKLREVGQLFNTMDPSPFHEKDLDHDAEEFIVSWAREFPLDEPVALIVHLGASPQEPEPQPMIERAVHHYFAYRVELNQLEFRHLMQDGRRSLLTGLVFWPPVWPRAGSSWERESERLPLSLEKAWPLLVGWRCGGRWRFTCMTGGHCAGVQGYSRNSAGCL